MLNLFIKSRLALIFLSLFFYPIFTLINFKKIKQHTTIQSVHFHFIAIILSYSFQRLINLIIVLSIFPYRVASPINVGFEGGYFIYKNFFLLVIHYVIHQIG